MLDTGLNGIVSLLSACNLIGQGARRVAFLFSLRFHTSLLTITTISAKCMNVNVGSFTVEESQDKSFIRME